MAEELTIEGVRRAVALLYKHHHNATWEHSEEDLRGLLETMPERGRLTDDLLEHLASLWCATQPHAMAMGPCFIRMNPDDPRRPTNVWTSIWKKWVRSHLAFADAAKTKAEIALDKAEAKVAELEKAAKSFKSIESIAVQNRDAMTRRAVREAAKARLYKAIGTAAGVTDEQWGIVDDAIDDVANPYPPALGA